MSDDSAGTKMTATLDNAAQILRQTAREMPGTDNAAGNDIVIVGGALRDALLGRAPREIDVAVRIDAQRFAAASAQRLDTHVVKIDDRIGVYRLPLDGAYIDIVQMAGSLEADLARRDFTFNALAYPLSELPAAGITAIDRGRIIDQHGGLADLDAGIIRMTGPRVMTADPLRALRAIRFHTELGFTLDAATHDAVAATAARLDAVSPERVGAELLRIFASPRASRGVALMEATGLLSVCFPDLDAGRGVEQRPHHRYNVFDHQLRAAAWLDLLLTEQPPQDPNLEAIWVGLWSGQDWTRSRWGDVRAQLARDAVSLRLATLLHDVAKPATRVVAADGRTHFFGHQEQGAQMARDALSRWRLPGALLDRVALLIDQHLRPGQVASPGEPPTARALHRFHTALGDAVADLCWLFLADSLATVGADVLLPRWPAYVAHVHRIVTWQPAVSAQSVRRLVDGHAVMKAAGLRPGPEVGRILAALEEAAATGEITSPEEALERAVSLARHSS